MPRELVRRAVPVQRGEQLSAAYWPRLESVRVPGSPDRIDLVLVGPSGVQVVVDRPDRPDRSSSAGEPDLAATALEDAAQRAGAASAAVAGLLPVRYRHAVTPAVRLVGRTEVVVTVGVVEAASPDVLHHMWRQRPRVLSTSEVRVVSGLLRACLEPCPAEAWRPARWWHRWGPPALVGASAAAGLAGAAAVALGWTPWGMR